MTRTSGTKEHEKFCQKDGWQYVPGGNHKVYRKKDPDGSIRKTVISHAAKEYHVALFKRILKKQLKVSEEYYFSVLGKKK